MSLKYGYQQNLGWVDCSSPSIFLSYSISSTGECLPLSSINAIKSAMEQIIKDWDGLVSVEGQGWKVREGEFEDSTKWVVEIQLPHSQFPIWAIEVESIHHLLIKYGIAMATIHTRTPMPEGVTFTTPPFYPTVWRLNGEVINGGDPIMEEIGKAINQA